MKTSEIREFDANRVRPLPRQPRQRFRGINELAASISEVGQLQAGIVTLCNDDPKFDAELVDGERRLRACVVAGMPFRAEVRGLGESEAIFAASFAANFGKQEHDSLEIAEALARLQQTKTLEQMGRLAGRSVAWVSAHLALLKLHPDVRKLMIVDDVQDTPRLTFSLAQLLTQAEHSLQIKLAKQIVKGEGMSLVAARRLVLQKVPATKPSGRTRERSIRAVSTIVRDMSDRVGIYLDMPPTELRATIGSASDVEKQQIIDSIEKLSEDLIDLAEEIEKQTPKAARKAS